MPRASKSALTSEASCNSMFPLIPLSVTPSTSIFFRPTTMLPFTPLKLARPAAFAICTLPLMPAISTAPSISPLVNDPFTPFPKSVICRGSFKVTRSLADPPKIRKVKPPSFSPRIRKLFASASTVTFRRSIASCVDAVRSIRTSAVLVSEVSIFTGPFRPISSTRAPGESSKVFRISSRTSVALLCETSPRSSALDEERTTIPAMAARTTRSTNNIRRFIFTASKRGENRHSGSLTTAGLILFG